jgi:diguanylate cyclase (GGDEF)-like protein
MSRFMPTLGTGVSRRDIALSPGVWLIVGLTFSVLGVSLAVIPYVLPEADPVRLRALGVFLGGCGLLFLRMQPPEPDTPTTHSILALSYITPALAVWAFAPQGTLALGSAIFAGPLTAVWMIEQRQTVLHLVAAACVLFLPAAFGIVDTATVAGLVFTVPSIWALAVCCIITLHAAEAQGEELTALVKRDPLTGIGNRRLLDEQLSLELSRHRGSTRALTVLALDLNGFKALNDTVGHAAGDELLKATARALQACARRRDIVVRQGGDEFCVVLPDTSPSEAEVVVSMIRKRLREIDTFGLAISTGIGMAAYPDDGDRPDALLHAADVRLRADKASHPGRGVITSATAASAAAIPLTPTPDTPANPVIGDAFSPYLDGLTRREMAVSRGLWRATAAMFVVYPVLGLLLHTFAPALRTETFLPICLGGLALGVLYLVVPAPAIGTIRNHLVVASTWVFPALALIGTRPAAAATIALAIWIGPVAAVRLTSRWQIVVHLTLASGLFFALSLLHLVTTATSISILLLLGTMWILALCCVVVLEAAERQGEELARLVRRDPLTGAGNRRAMQERLSVELAHHRLAGAHLTVIALDLNGFKHLNDTVGHAAGDELLCTVARELTTIVDGRGDVVRQGGDEFSVLLPWCTALEAEGVMAAIRTRLGEIVVAGVPVSTGVGAATFPTDGVDIDGLLDRADNRLRADKYGADAGATPRIRRADASGDGRTMSMDCTPSWSWSNLGRLS